MNTTAHQIATIKLASGRSVLVTGELKDAITSPSFDRQSRQYRLMPTTDAKASLSDVGVIEKYDQTYATTRDAIIAQRNAKHDGHAYMVGLASA